MLDFEVYRISVIPQLQKGIIQLTHSELITKVLYHENENMPRRGSFWAIGDVVKVDTNGYYFHFGKTTKKKIGQYVNRSFSDIPSDIADYTHVLIDVEMEIVAIAKKNELAPTIEAIAKKLVHYFEFVCKNQSYLYDIRISPIRTFNDFYQILHTSYAIRKFEFTFTKPNPPDQTPWMKLFEDFSGKANSNQGKVGLTSDSDLDRKLVEEVARSVNVSNNTASITYRPFEHTTLKRVKLDESQTLSFSVDSDIPKNRLLGLDSARMLFRRERDGDDQ